MLYLFNSGARVGYIDNILNTMHLPYGSENLYQYSYESNSYVDDSIAEGTIKGRKIKDANVLIVFINKDKIPYEYIPLRKAKLILKEDKNGRSYFYVSLREHCSYEGNYELFNKAFINKFGEKLFRSDTKQTKDTIDQKNNKGFLAFYGDDIPELIKSDENSWKATVRKLSECSLFKENVVFTKVDITKNMKPVACNSLRVSGSPSYTFKKGTKYTAEMSYYVPFHDQDPTINFDVEMFSNPDLDMIKGASLVQKLNIMDGMAKFKFFATDVCKCEEIIFKVCEANTKSLKISYKPFAYKVSNNIWQKISLLLLIIVNIVLLYAINYSTALIDNVTEIKELSPWYFVLLTISSALSTGVIWLITKIFGKKK